MTGVFIGSVNCLKLYANYCMCLDACEFSEKFMTSQRLRITPRAKRDPDAAIAALSAEVQFDTSIMGLLLAEQIHQGCLSMFL